MALRCKYCGVARENQEDLDLHELICQHMDFIGEHSKFQRETSKSTDKTLNCKMCGKRFSTVSNRNKHQKTCNLSEIARKHQRETSKSTDKTLNCKKCGKRFSTASNRKRHQKTCNLSEITGLNRHIQGNSKQKTPPPSTSSDEHRCHKCGKTYPDERGLRRHIQWHGKQPIQRKKTPPPSTSSYGKQKTPPPSTSSYGKQKTPPPSTSSYGKQKTPPPSTSFNEHRCHKCGKTYPDERGLRRHIQWHGKQPVQRKKTSSQATRTSYRCRRCLETFTNRRDLYLHGMRTHYNQNGGALQQRPWDVNNAPWLRDGENDEMRAVYESNSALILKMHQLGPIQSVYNFPLDNDVSMNQLLDFADTIYARQERAFRLNIVFGVILQNRETGSYRYFVPYSNNGIFERPVYISKRSDLERLRQRLERKDIIEEVLRIRHNTKWIPALVTNVNFLITETYYPLGQGQIPDYILNKRSIKALVKNQRTNMFYDDNLCAFRCLALHRGYDIRCLENITKTLYFQWCDEPVHSFRGLSLDDFPAFESRFCVNVDVYNLAENGFARSVYKSRGRYDSTMRVNLYGNHLSYITNFALYAQKFQCGTCDRHFKSAFHMRRHQRICENSTKYVFPGGLHQTLENIYERLEQHDIWVLEDERVFPWYICYDFEALQKRINDQPTQFLRWTREHIPVSVSVCSNVDGYTEPECIIDSDPDDLVNKMVVHMKNIACRTYELAYEKWGWVLEAIDEMISKDKDNDDDGDEESRKNNPLRKLYEDMERYMSVVPVLGFNSAKYDLNLVKRILAKHLNMHQISETFVVKKNNAYMCVATDSLKFLDMAQYLAAGASYADFLKAFHVTQQKGFFPYEWFDSYEKLDFTALPPHECFYSHIKGQNISEEDYEYCCRVWEDCRMSNFKDFLVWYNNLDVVPFVQAVERFQQFYFEKNIDVFKTAISVPGIARQLLFRAARKQNVTFALFDNNNKDLYHTIKRNIVGGPSIIFTRRHCAMKTRIRGGHKLCQRVLGFDAVALYLQAIGLPMPVGSFVRRHEDEEFRPKVRDKYMLAYYWMEWLMHSRNITIQHKLNTGREVKIGKFLVDGCMNSTNPSQSSTLFQFHGCYFHGHACDLTKSIKSERWHNTREQKYRKTLEISRFLKQDHQLEEIWECEFRQYCREHPTIYQFINSMRPEFYQSRRGKVSTQDILSAVSDGVLFGMVEVDIQVPEQWPQSFQKSSLSPYEYFQEMSPLFCSTDVPFSVIGEHMQSHIRENNLSQKPKRLLVGGMKARQILLATPLLKWYLDHGLAVTRIYQVVEFQQKRCFREFVKDVSDARRRGDVDPNTAIVADTMKVIGNSGYGSLIMDKTKHRKVQYIMGENEVCLSTNDPLFQNLVCLDPENQFYEVESSKRVIKLDLPIQLGYFILQYAKLRMLEFYYDFMDVYVDRSDFEYAEMDTDSAYFAISGSCLEDVIKAEMIGEYRKGLHDFCTDTELEADAKYRWFPRACCSSHKQHDKRQAGLLKLEYEGLEIIGLCSKTYILRNVKKDTTLSSKITAYRLKRRALNIRPRRFRYVSTHKNEYKFSSKGISKRLVKRPMSKFRKALDTKRPQSGLNRGFRVRGNALYTYTQRRRGFSYLYCKRRVLDDGIHAKPLDITLCPFSEEDNAENHENLTV